MSVTDPAAVDLLASVSRLVRTARTYAHLRHQQLGRAGLSLSILARLSEGPTRPGDLATQLGVTPSSVSRASALMVDGGWVRRTTDPADARACSLEITDDGRLELARVRARQARLVSGMLQDWDDDKARTLTTLLDELGTALHGSALHAAPEPTTGPDSVVAPSSTTSTPHQSTTTHEKAYA